MRGAAYLIKWGDDQWVVEAPTIQLAIDAWIRAQEQGQGFSPEPDSCTRISDECVIFANPPVARLTPEGEISLRELLERGELKLSDINSKCHVEFLAGGDDS